MLHFERTERDRLREEARNARRAMATIRAAVEAHAPPGSLPPQQFLADFAEEATIIVNALKHSMRQGIEVRPMAP